MNKVYDISLTMDSRMPVWPGGESFNSKKVCSIQAGDAANVTRLDFSAHNGTHIDAPCHFLDGQGDVCDIKLDSVLGETLVVEYDGDTDINAEFLKTLDLDSVSRILFKTKNSRLWQAGQGFNTDYIAVSLDAASYLVEMNMTLVGVDYLSVEAFNAPKDHPVHKKLLGGGIVLLEGLDLSKVPVGKYELICLPLKIAGSDGSPVRAVLRELS